MVWTFISILLFFCYLLGDTTPIEFLFASGLFAIAGAIDKLIKEGGEEKDDSE